MKKFVSMFLTCISVFTLSFQVYATTLQDEKVIEKLPNTIQVMEGNDGIYITSVNPSKSIIANKTEFEEIYQLSTGQFLMKAPEEQYVPVYKHSLNLFDENLSNKLNNIQISDESKEIILKIANEDKINNDLVEKSIPQNLDIKKSNVEVTIFTPNISATAASYYNYNGTQFYDELITFSGRSTNWFNVSTGTNAKTVAQGLFNIGYAVAGLTINSVAIFSTGVSCLTGFMNATGYSSIPGNGGDAIQCKVVHNDTIKTTYVKDYTGSFVIGCVTQKVLVTSQSIYQNYYINGAYRQYTAERNNFNIQTPNYSNPAPLAYRRYLSYNLPETEYVTLKVHNSSINFGI